MSSPTKRLRKHSQDEFLSLMIAAKRLPTSSYQNLTDLNLSNLQLIRIDSFPFGHLSRLISLDLSFNQLVSIDANWTVGQKVSIEKFNLSHNKLETLLFLKDFHSLKFLNVTENLFRVNERFLLFSISPQLETLIDANRDQLDDEQLKYDQWCQLIETKIDRLWAVSYYEKYRQELQNPSIAKKLLDDFRQSMVKILCKQQNFSQIHSSPLANEFFTKKIEQLCSSPIQSSAPITRRSTFKTHLTSEFSQLMENKRNFIAKKFLRCHHQTETNLLTTPVKMCVFEPNSNESILATCGGQKLCFINCSTGEVTHVYQVPILRSTAMPIGRKFKEKANGNVEFFSSLCWMEIENEGEMMKMVAVGATNGHIYLVSPKWKVMFGHLEISNASISCLTWDPLNPSQLIVASYQTVRLINIQSYFDRLRQFIRKQIKSSETIDFSLSNGKLSVTEIYHLDHPDGSMFTITDLLIYPQKSSILLVATTSGLFLVQNQTSIKMNFPKSMCTIGENIESLAWIDERSGLFAMNILGYDQICSIDLEQSLVQKQLVVLFQFVDLSRQIACRMSIVRLDNENDSAEKSFECVIGHDKDLIVHHRIRIGSMTLKKSKKIQFDDQRTDLPCSMDQSSTILSTSLNERYLCFTTTNNLICIYEREQC